MSDKIYTGNGKEKTFDGGGSIITLTLDIDQLVREYGNHGFKTDQGKRKIRIKVARSRQEDQYGNTHYSEIDQWHPDTYMSPEPIELVGGTRQSSQQPSQSQTTNPFPSYKPSSPPTSAFNGNGQKKFEDDIPF